MSTTEKRNSTATIALLTSATATGAGTAKNVPTKPMPSYSFHATGTTSSGSGAATIAIQVSNDNSNWLTAGTISLTLATTASGDGLAINAPWAYVRANVTAISGTGASVNVYMGV